MFDRTTAQLRSQKRFIKFCNNFVGKSSLNSIGFACGPDNLDSQPDPENKSNPCGVSVPSAQISKLNTPLFNSKVTEKSIPTKKIGYG